MTFLGPSLSTMLFHLKMVDGMNIPKPRRSWKLVHVMAHLV